MIECYELSGYGFESSCSHLKIVRFRQIEQNLCDSECRSLKYVIQRKDQVIKKADKDNTVVIIDHDKYVESVKQLILDNPKFTMLDISSEKQVDFLRMLKNFEK